MSKLIVYTGPMFSRKSGHLLVAAERAQIAGASILAIKPRIDIRSEGLIVSRRIEDGASVHVGMIAAHEIGDAEELSALFRDSTFNVLIADEVQFFSLEGEDDQLGWFGRAIRELLFTPGRDVRIFIAGLDQDFAGKPFGCMPGLMALADEVVKVTAICGVPGCGQDAQHSQRLTHQVEQVGVGDNETYAPRCRTCFVPPV